MSPKRQPLTGDRERAERRRDDPSRAGKNSALTTRIERTRTAGMRSARSRVPAEPGRPARPRRAARAGTAGPTAAAGTPPAGRAATREELRQRVAAVQPARTPAGSSPVAVDIAASSARPDGSATVGSPRLNIVRTVIGSAARMTKTTVKLIVLSSGSLVRPWAKTDWKTPRPSVRKSGDEQVRAAAGHAAEDAGRDRRGDRGGDEARGEARRPRPGRAGRSRRVEPRSRRERRRRSPRRSATIRPSGSAIARPVRLAPPGQGSGVPSSSRR